MDLSSILQNITLIRDSNDDNGDRGLEFFFIYFFGISFGLLIIFFTVFGSVAGNIVNTLKYPDIDPEKVVKKDQPILI